MGDERVEDQMIEIGDPTDETPALEPPPRLVIEYRERGVPWMLIPPMIALSAVAAVMVSYKLSPPRHVVIRVPAEPVAVAPPIAAGASDSLPPAKPGTSTGTAPEVGPGPVPAAPLGLVASESPTVAPAPADVPPAVAAVETPQEVAPFPRVQGLGFDPKGLVDATPPVDPAVAPAAGRDERRDPPAGETPPAVDPGPRELPEEVDPSLLPIDPREARRRRAQRAAEARQRAEADRGKFHVELRAICRKSGERAGPQIEALCKQYGTDVDPTIQAQATRLLNGPAAGVDRPVRINLLRQLGYSEGLILSDIAGILMSHEDGTARGGARSADDIRVHAAQLLLSYPPTRVASPSRPVSTVRAAR